MGLPTLTCVVVDAKEGWVLVAWCSEE